MARILQKFKAMEFSSHLCHQKSLNYPPFKLGSLFLLFMISCQTSSRTTFGNVDGYRIGLTTIPAQPVEGSNKFKVILKDEAGKAVDGAKIMAHYFMAPQGNRSILTGSVDGKFNENGEYIVLMNIPREGEWTINFRVTTPQKKVIAANFEVKTGKTGARFIG